MKVVFLIYLLLVLTISVSGASVRIVTQPDPDWITNIDSKTTSLKLSYSAELIEEGAKETDVVFTMFARSTTDCDSGKFTDNEIKSINKFWTQNKEISFDIANIIRGVTYFDEILSLSDPSPFIIDYNDDYPYFCLEVVVFFESSLGNGVFSDFHSIHYYYETIDPIVPRASGILEGNTSLNLDFPSLLIILPILMITTITKKIKNNVS